MRGSEVKIWCINVDTSTTRNDLESASRRYWERLCSNLRVEASSRLVAIVEFLSSASKELERRPRNVEEVGLAYEAHARIEAQSSGMAEEMEAIAGLSKVLAAWTSEKLEGRTIVEWLLEWKKDLIKQSSIFIFKKNKNLAILNYKICCNFISFSTIKIINL